MTYGQTLVVGRQVPLLARLIYMTQRIRKKTFLLRHVLRHYTLLCEGGKQKREKTPNRNVKENYNLHFNAV